MDNIAHSLTEHPRIQLLRRIENLQLISLLAAPNWHILCDETMQAYFLEAGLPREKMTEALERADFLAADFAHSGSAKSTLVVATRRSELAVLGVLKRRNMRAMGLFRTLLPRLVAHATLRMNVEETMGSPAPKIQYAILSQSSVAAELLASALTALGCGKPSVHVSEPQILFAQYSSATDFEPLQWWKMLLRTQAQDGVFGTIWLWQNIARFLGFLAPTDLGLLHRQMGKCTILHLNYPDLLRAAVALHVADGAMQTMSADRRIDDILVRVQKLRADHKVMDLWLQQIGAEIMQIDHDALCADPTETALIVARCLGLKTNRAGLAIRPAVAHDSPEFARLLYLAKLADQTS